MSPGMQLESPEELVHALRESGLFTREQFEAIASELTPLGRDASAVMRHLLSTERITIYQLKKVVRGKAAELLVGPYVITDKLGEGGMGKVFRARRADGSETVALKVVRAALVANPIVRGRYAREVQATSVLAHPNIVRLFDAGEANGRFYLAMEFVDGIDLARLMQDYGSLEVAEACEYARQTALGLQHAHEKGFVHRDIKPSNIVVAGERHLPQATEPAVVKILDLGLARAIDPDDMVVPNLTRDHTVVGTPDYMAPEQASNSKRADPRSDLYSLGCALYFLLTGEVPFPNRGPIEKILAHQTQMPAPLQAVRPNVPAGVAQIVARLLAKKPEERIQTAGELAAELEPFTHYPHNAPPVVVSVRERAGREPLPSASTAMGQVTAAPSITSLGSLSPLELSRVELPAQQPPPVAPSDPTPRPRGSDAEGPPKPPAKKGKTPQSLPKKHPRRTPRKSPRRTPTILWVALALGGVLVLAVMLWLMG